MPDFTEEVHFHCASVESYETEVKGSTGTHKVWVGRANWPGAAQYEFQCDCKGFKFRKTCKHIKQVKESESYCGWHQMIGGGEVVRDENNVACCPECGNLAIAMRYAV